MSLLASLRLSLESMGFLQLCSAFAALLAYSVALGASFTARTRAGAGGVAVLSASGFAVAAPEWMAGVVLLMIGVAGVGLFAASTWLLASVFGVASTRGRLAADTPFAAGLAVAYAGGGRSIRMGGRLPWRLARPPCRPGWAGERRSPPVPCDHPPFGRVRPVDRTSIGDAAPG